MLQLRRIFHERKDTHDHGPNPHGAAMGSWMLVKLRSRQGQLVSCTFCMWLRIVTVVEPRLPIVHAFDLYCFGVHVRVSHEHLFLVMAS